MNAIIDYALIGARIKQRRNEKKITQEQLANELSISVFYLSKIENSRCMASLDLLAMIAKSLDLDLAYLITGVSKLEREYYDNQLIQITSKASPKQLELIIRVAKAILNE